jgi:hypothetical protein
MHVSINVKSPNNNSKLQMGFNSAFKGLCVRRLDGVQNGSNNILCWYKSSVLLTQNCAGGKIETNEIGKASGAYGEG